MKRKKGKQSNRYAPPRDDREEEIYSDVPTYPDFTRQEDLELLRSAQSDFLKVSRKVYYIAEPRMLVNHEKVFKRATRRERALKRSIDIEIKRRTHHESN